MAVYTIPWLGSGLPMPLLAAVVVAFLPLAGIAQLAALRPHARRVPFVGAGIRWVVIAVLAPMPGVAPLGVDIRGHTASSLGWLSTRRLKRCAPGSAAFAIALPRPHAPKLARTARPARGSTSTFPRRFGRQRRRAAPCSVSPASTGEPREPKWITASKKPLGKPPKIAFDAIAPPMNKIKGPRHPACFSGHSLLLHGASVAAAVG